MSCVPFFAEVTRSTATSTAATLPLGSIVSARGTIDRGTTAASDELRLRRFAEREDHAETQPQGRRRQRSGPVRSLLDQLGAESPHFAKLAARDHRSIALGQPHIAQRAGQPVEPSARDQNIVVAHAREAQLDSAGVRTVGRRAQCTRAIAPFLLSGLPASERQLLASTKPADLNHQRRRRRRSCAGLLHREQHSSDSIGARRSVLFRHERHGERQQAPATVLFAALPKCQTQFEPCHAQLRECLAVLGRRRRVRLRAQHVHPAEQRHAR